MVICSSDVRNKSEPILAEIKGIRARINVATIKLRKKKGELTEEGKDELKAQVTQYKVKELKGKEKLTGLLEKMPDFILIDSEMMDSCEQAKKMKHDLLELPWNKRPPAYSVCYTVLSTYHCSFDQ